jgi:hypothetical protein
MRHHIQNFGSGVEGTQFVTVGSFPGVKVASHLHLVQVKLSLCLFGSASRHEDV